MPPIIEVKNISKKYNIGRFTGRYVALRDILTGAFMHPLKFLKEKVKNIFNHGNQQEFWALRDVSFSVETGEVVGIIGKNGAGKSTLLKILSQITPPTGGQITVRGRIGSLLEVGTGFHSELTGRENIFLNGAILGMPKKEIEKKFDQIVEFAGVEKFIDTPVKRYSSGMFVRLAFSVAAHLEPDILLVDEVLAVGDAEFQKKCLGKMEEVTKKQGRTIIFVSHNMAAIRQLCTKCVLLADGKVVQVGETAAVINYYLNNITQDSEVSEYRHSGQDRWVNDSVKLIAARLTNEEGQLFSDFASSENIYITIEYEILEPLKVLYLDSGLYNEEYLEVFHTIDNDMPEYHEKPRVPGKYTSRYKVPKNFLNAGTYFVTVAGRNPGIKQYFHVDNALTFRVSPAGGPLGMSAPRGGVVCPALEWVTKAI